MPSKQLNELPAEVQGLPQGAQNIFLAAFNSAQADGMSENGALKVAWDTVNSSYERSQDGTWYPKPTDSNIHHKSVQSGGN